MHAPSSDLILGPVRLARLPHAGGRGEPAARAWLGACLGVAPQALELARDAQGRPALGLPGHDCNWSHSGAHLVVALAVGARVGVDVEVRRVRPKALEIARRYFHPQEAAVLAGLPAPQRDAAFLRLWCAKEAVLKGHGRGLAFGLDRFRIAGFEGDAPLHVAQADAALGGDWTLHALEWADALAVVAWRSQDPASA